jgi:hypothetical protein
VDATIHFMEHDLQKAVNMKLIWCIFERLSGQQTNLSEIFRLSEIYMINTKIFFGCEAVFFLSSSI